MQKAHYLAACLLMPFVLTIFLLTRIPAVHRFVEGSLDELDKMMYGEEERAGGKF